MTYRPYKMFETRERQIGKREDEISSQTNFINNATSSRKKNTFAFILFVGDKISS